MRSRWLSALLTVLLLCALPAAAHAVSFGATVDGDFDRYQSGVWTWTQVQQSLTMLRRTGATIGQTSSDWSATESQRPLHGRHRFDWKLDDTIVSGLAQAHLRWDPDLDYTPKWAQQHVKPVRSGKVVSPLPPANYGNYGVYATAFARRYGVGGSFWRMHPKLPREPVTSYEIWNEPDDRFTWGPDVDLQNYARLYSVAYTAIRRVAPHATIITAGLAFPASSTSRLLGAMRGLPIGGFGVHAYATNPQRTIARAAYQGTELAAYGRAGTPMIANEFGWDSQPKAFQYAPKRVLMRYVTQTIAGIAAIKHVSQVVPFEWTDPQWGLSNGGLAAGIARARADHHS